jgi:hypothetical protein
MNSMTDVNGWPTTSLRWSRTWAGKTGKSGSDSAFLQRTLRSRKPADDKSRRLIGIGGLLKQYWSRAEWHWPQMFASLLRHSPAGSAVLLAASLVHRRIDWDLGY